MKHAIAIIIPAYNESTVIGRVLREIPRSITIRGKTKSIITIVVDDGSVDKTNDVVRKHKNVHLITHVINMGAGAATRTGLHFARTIGVEIAVTMDADGQHHIKDTMTLIKKLYADKSVDVVIGSRLLNSKGMPWYRVVGNKGLSFITFLLFGVSVTDSQSGLKAFNHKALENIEYASNNFAFCSEMLWSAKKASLKIIELPIRAIYTDYSIKKGQTNWDVYHILSELIKNRFASFIHE